MLDGNAIPRDGKLGSDGRAVAHPGSQEVMEVDQQVWDAIGAVRVEEVL